MGDRSEQGGTARPFFRSFEENSRSYLTKRIGKMGRSPTGAVDQTQVRQPPRTSSYERNESARSRMMAAKKRIALAFQGGGFPAGALGAGVVRYLVEKGAFAHHDIERLFGDLGRGAGGFGLLGLQTQGQDRRGARGPGETMAAFRLGVRAQCQSGADGPALRDHQSDEPPVPVRLRRLW